MRLENEYPMGTFNEAIKVLEHLLKGAKKAKLFGFDYARGFEGAINHLKRENKGFIFSSGDTPYKIELTKWIESKNTLGEG